MVETKRGHDLGRLILEGSAIPNTGVPGDIGGYTEERVIRAPAGGGFEPLAAIGDRGGEGAPGRARPTAESKETSPAREPGAALDTW